MVVDAANSNGPFQPVALLHIRGKSACVSPSGSLRGWLINGYCASDKTSRKSFPAEVAGALQTGPGAAGRGPAVGHFTVYSQNLSLERGLACIVQSWFFCFLLALPSPFPSCADVKGCEVTAWGRCWVGGGRRGGWQCLAKLSVHRVSVTSVLLNTAKAASGAHL